MFVRLVWWWYTYKQNKTHNYAADKFSAQKLLTKITRYLKVVTVGYNIFSCSIFSSAGLLYNERVGRPGGGEVREHFNCQRPECLSGPRMRLQLGDH